MRTVDIKYMIPIKIQRILVVLLAGFSSVIFSRETSLNKPAVQAPPRTVASFNQGQEGNEIDEKIDNYFKNRIGTGKEDLDQKKLTRLFGDDSEIIETENTNVISLANRGRLDYMSSYRIVTGDTIYKVAKKTGLTPAKIIKHNPELKKRPLYIGEEIIIVKKNYNNISSKSQKRVTYHRIKKGEFLSHIAKRYRVSLKSIYKSNRLNSKSTIRVGQKIKIVRRGKRPPRGYHYVASFKWPVRGVITSSYGRRSNPFTRSRQYHKGIDIGAKIGSTFMATKDGVVILSARMGGYGNCIFIRHVNGFVSVYGHNKLNLVKVGDVVKKGQIIGEVGRTGTATGPHLHFEIRKWKKPLNPILALRYKELAPRKVAGR